ncbi:hypothetical protein PTKIN_Ptkin13bG0184000 [Pterospermum kingtungense]
MTVLSSSKAKTLSRALDICEKGEKMVLSNKKLKQKLRAELLAKKEAEPDLDSKNPDSNSELQSLKSLLDSVTQKPRLSKRETRRKNVSNQKTEEKREAIEVKEEEENNEEVEKKKKKKRKREEEKVKEEKTTSQKKRKKKNQNKKKNEENIRDEQGVLQVENGTKSQLREDVATKVYVGGIPYRYTEDDIRYYFEGCGTIIDVDCMKFPDTGKFRGIAIISFETEAAAKEALALDRAEMGGMQLTIQPYKSTRANRAIGFAPKMVEGYNRIYVGNLSWDITEDDLKKLFSDCNVSSIRFGKDKETGEFRGYAHVDFSDSVSVAMALKLDQEIVCGRPVKISCAVPKTGVKTQSRSHSTSNEIPTSKEVPTVNEAPIGNEAPTINEADNGGASVSSGKLRRRTCYECGQKGHISSACPNMKTAETANSVNEGPIGNEAPTVNEEPISNEAPTVNEADNGGSSVSSGKLRRRTCYECGQKGHISSACPNKKTAETANTN